MLAVVNLGDLRQELDRQEETRLAVFATRSSQAIRRRFEERIQEGHRQNFAVDADRILHSRAYTRYIDKTQVFYLIEHEHISHRVLHVQLLSKISRTIGRYLRLNEDLLEAIALAGGTASSGDLVTLQDLADLRHSFVMRQGQSVPVDFHRLLHDGD